MVMFVAPTRRAGVLPLSRRRLLQHSVRSYATVDSQAHEQRDLVIVGGGPAGLALASALGKYTASAAHYTLSYITQAPQNLYVIRYASR